MGFTTPIDIGNRALQHCGMARIANFTDGTSNAHEVGFVYDKVRRAELRRNLWRFATRRVILRPLDTTSYLIVPSGWNATTNYNVGSVVKWLGLVWFSLTRANVGAQPDLRPDVWTLYFGPLTVSPWDSTIGSTIGAGYFAGELVYNPANEGAIVYLSLASSNTDTPGVFPQWSPTITYNTGDTVTLGTAQVIFDPGTIPVFFDPGGGGAVLPLNAFLGNWISQRDLNIGNAPDLGDTTQWQAITTGPNVRTGQKWLQLDSGLTVIEIPYPLTAGPVSQIDTRNAFWLPNGFLRQAPSDPRAGSFSRLGGPSGVAYTDWLIEGNYIVTTESNPIMLRFVADVADVTQMDDMFCEGLAARIAREVAPLLCVEKSDKVSRVATATAAYREIMADARAINGIETGSVEPAEDEWIAVRL